MVEPRGGFWIVTGMGEDTLRQSDGSFWTGTMVEKTISREPRGGFWIVTTVDKTVSREPQRCFRKRNPDTNQGLLRIDSRSFATSLSGNNRERRA
jgi:hypothetical protein